jgi:hypothetical protein
MMSDELERIWKEAAVLQALSLNFPKGAEKSHEILSQDSWSPDRYLNPGPPEYEARMLITRPPRSVGGVCVIDIYVVWVWKWETEQYCDLRRVLQNCFQCAWHAVPQCWNFSMWCALYKSIRYICPFGDNDHDDHVGMRLRLWTAATNGPVFILQVIYEYG